jgi:predicted transcriptional regulator
MRRPEIAQISITVLERRCNLVETTLSPTRESFISKTANIVASYVAQHEVATSTLPNVIKDVFEALRGLPAENESIVNLLPAVHRSKSVYPDYIICLDDGRRFKTLKRHLWQSYRMTPEAYRAKWGLPDDYPMVAPNYAALRSRMAVRSKLKRQRTAKVFR